MIKRILCGILVTALALASVGCSGSLWGVFTDDEPPKQPPQYIPPVDDDGDDGDNEKESTNSAANKLENPFVNAEKHPVSTVSLNPSHASYEYFRSLVNKDYTFAQLQKCSYDFKTEEFLNFFEFGTSKPEGGELFGIDASMISTPWNEGTRLISFSFDTADVERSEANNFVFHVDVTESMAREEILPLFKRAFAYFVDSLGVNDKVSVIVCSGEETVLVDGYGIDRRADIISAVESIAISDKSGNGAGLDSVYEVAREHYIEGGNNCVILVSDGDISDKLGNKIVENANEGIYTSVLGFGDGNHRSNKLESLAESGGGRYYYIDSESRAEIVLGRAIYKPVYAVAEGATIKIDFDSSYVSEYRLIGYVYRGEIDSEQAVVEPSGKIYAGNSITVCYEVKFNYTEQASVAFADVVLEYKSAADGEMKSQSFIASSDIYSSEPDDNMKFMSAVIRSVMVLQGSEYIENVTLADILEELQQMNLDDNIKRAEFRALIEKIVSGTKK